jgi:hypothetical protein
LKFKVLISLGLVISKLLLYSYVLVFRCNIRVE